MKTAVLFLAFLSVALPLQAGWLVPPDTARIVYSAEKGKGHATFDGALKELSESDRIRRLDVINGCELFSEETFQQELFAGLERDAPRELKEARDSSGNMHNPKMHQLWKPFEKALLATPTIKRLSASLAAHGLTISRVEREKFELRNTITDPKRRFHGFLWLYVTQSHNDIESTIKQVNTALAVEKAMDDKLAANAEVVLRVRRLTGGEGSKYWWSSVQVLQVLKNQSNDTFIDTLSVAAESGKDGVPEGESTLYLDRYNKIDKTFWKLVGGETSTGVSHVKKP